MITTLLLVPLLPLLLPTTYAIPTGGRGTPSRPPVFNVLSPAATPLHLTPTEPTLLSEVAMNMWMIPPAVAVLPAVVGTVVGDGVLPAQKTGGPLGNATSARTVARAMMARSIGLDMEMEADDFDDEMDVLQDEPQEVEDEVPEESDTLARRDVASVVRKAKTALQAAITSPSVTCLGSSANDSTISSLFYYGGPGTTVNLCAGARILLTNAVFFYFANQTLQTVGRPNGNTRATLVVTGAQQSCAVYGAIDGTNNIALRNIQIDGQRTQLGIIYGGLANIEMGGNTYGQTIDHVRSFEPRGWSALHGIEGYNNQCRNMVITINDIGPSGHAPSGAQQFRKRDTTGTYSPGQWADGISNACSQSLIQGNTIIDATDGAIVIFGAPGTLVTGNTIISSTRQLLGGINMVDWAPYAGAFTGTVVKGNTIRADSNFIKVGIAIGGMTWGVDNRTSSRTFDGTVQNNVFTSGPTGYFGFAIGMVGHNAATVSSNTALTANFGSVYSTSCFPQYPNPTPQAFVADQSNTPASTYNAGSTFAQLVLLICSGPGPILKRGNAV